MINGSVDHHLIDALNLAGLALGILGSIFLTYDILDRPGGLLRLLLRVSVPGVLGALVVLSVLPLALGDPVLSENIDILTIAFDLAWFGAVVGIYNGLFVGSQTKTAKPSFFSVRDAIVGFLIAFILFQVALIGILSVAGIRVSFVPLERDYFLEQAVIDALVCAIGAAIWRRANWSVSNSLDRPPLISARGLIIGLIAASLLAGAVFTVFNVATTGVYIDPDPAYLIGYLIDTLIVGLLVGAIPGAVTGALTQYLFWWVNHLPERGIGAIGVVLIVIAFGAQAVQPILGFFDIPVTAEANAPIVYQSPLTSYPFLWAKDQYCFPANNGYHVRGICAAPIPDRADMDITVDVKQIHGPNFSNFGIFFRYAANTWYEFNISSNGSWRATKCSVSASNVGGCDDLVSSTHNQAISTGQSVTNLIEVQVRGTQFSFYANGTFLGKVEDASYPSGSIGLVVDDLNTECVFTNLSITS